MCLSETLIWGLGLGELRRVALATVCQHFILHMECVTSMYLRKTCPKCDTVVHVKRAACGCNSVSYQSVHLINTCNISVKLCRGFAALQYFSLYIIYSIAGIFRSAKHAKFLLFVP